MKPANKELLRARAERALQNLYHNATPTYPRELYGCTDDYFTSWFGDVAQWEIEYIADGGAYGKNYRATLAASCNAGRYKSERAREFYIRKGMRAMREEQSAHAWERISEYGKLYTWGRGGRTLAPDRLIKQRGGSSFSINEAYADELTAADTVELIRVVESFNRYVESWCNGLPEQWREHCADEDAQALAEKRAASVRKAKETRERNYWAARDVITTGGK